MEKIMPEKIYIWGTGKIAQEINENYRLELQYLDIIGYIDNDSQKWGKNFYGKKIFPPNVLLEKGEKYIYIANAFEKEICKQIKDNLYECKIIEEDIISRVQILLRYQNSRDPEIKNIVEYLKKNELRVFNYLFVEKYNRNYNIYYDDERKMYYTIYYKKKMYFSRKLNTREKVEEYYKSILVEQDIESPHRYLAENVKVEKDVTIVDAGAAEGNFSLAYIENAKKIYIFEPDRDWYEALLATFEPYLDKVVIYNMYLSNYCNSVTTTLDEIVNEEVNMIKMDIEGEELYALKGARKVLERSQNIKCIVCTYHQEFAYEVIKDYLEKMHMKTSCSKGYMWYPDYGVRAPILRRGLIKAEKEIKSKE